MTELLLDTISTAKRIGIASATLATMRVRGGGPPFIKVGARALYPVADLEAWIASQPRKSTTAPMYGTSTVPTRDTANAITPATSAKEATSAA